MKSNRNVYIIYFGLCGLLGVFLLLSAGGSSDDLTAALPPPGPGPAGDNVSMESMLLGPGGVGGAGQEGNSVFDSEFFNEHRPDSEEKLEAVGEDGSPEILEPANANNPVNPQTGLPYPDKLMDRFQALRKKFPGNNVIPRRETPEEKEANREKRQQEFALRSKVKLGNANEEEINAHYNNEVKGIKDRLEILDFIMEKQNKHMSPEIKAQYEKILKRNKDQLANIEKQRESALTKLLE